MTWPRPYYQPQENDPEPGVRLFVNIERPLLERENFKTMALDFDQGPRMRVTIEGEANFVERLLAAMQDTYATIDGEIQADEASKHKPLAAPRSSDS